jgi:hypothetical protein
MGGAAAQHCHTGIGKRGGAAWGRGMSKQRSAPQLPDEDELPEGTGAGISDLPSDNAFWLDRFNLSHEEWALVDAIWHIDAHGDKAPLLKLLRGTGKQRDYYLADLLERYELKRPRSRQRTPAYALTLRERVIAIARYAIRNRPEGQTVAAAVEEQEKLCKTLYHVTFNPGALRLAYEGQRRGSRPGKRGARYIKRNRGIKPRRK